MSAAKKCYKLSVSFPSRSVN